MTGRIATTTAVDCARLLEFCRPRHHPVLITRRTDGGRVTPRRWGPIATRGFPARLAD